MNLETLLVVIGLLGITAALRCVLLYNENKFLRRCNAECMEAADTQSKRAAKFSAELWELKESQGRATGELPAPDSLVFWPDDSYLLDEDDIDLQTFGELPRIRAIGITGPARSGKDTTADYLLGKLGPRWSITSYAEPIKKMLEVIGVDCSDDAKETIDPRFGVTPRFMMQTLGTEWGRGMIKNSMWEDIVEEKIAISPRIVKDVRFDDEADQCRGHGIVLHILRRGGIPGQHRSEAGVQFGEGDVDIHNSGTERQLYNQLDNLKI